jgi:hypothetical protein
MTLAEVKLAASMSPSPSAILHSRELAANASIATAVNNTVWVKPGLRPWSIGFFTPHSLAGLGCIRVR